MHAPGLDRASVAALARALRNASALSGRRVGSRLRELVILHVSSINGCPVCSAMHGVWGRAVGLGADDIDRARDCEVSATELDPHTVLALRYAELRTLRREDEEPETVARFERWFTPAEQREIRAVTDLFTFNNRFNNTWERWVPGAKRRRERLHLCASSSG